MTVVPVTSSHVKGGHVALSDLKVVLPRHEQTSYVIKATTLAMEMTICSVRVKSKGRNILCLTDDVQETYTKLYWSDVLNDAIELDLFSVTNIGVSILCSL